MTRITTGLLAGGTALLCSLGAATAQEDTTLRVCASAKDAPYSDARGEGFENRIAAILADEAGMELDLVILDRDAIYAFRDGIETGKCDVLVGVDTGDDRVLTSKPYYRSGYAFVSQTARGFDGDTWQDIDREGFSTFAYRYHTPAETILKYTGRYEYNLVYQASLINFSDRRNQYTQVPAERVVSEVASGTADLGIAFAPDIARYVRDAREPLTLTLITNEIERQDGVIIPLQYSQSVGVSKARPELLDVITAALDSGQDRIARVLAEEGIPTLPLDAS